jgi:hypothetical protein
MSYVYNKVIQLSRSLFLFPDLNRPWCHGALLARRLSAGAGVSRGSTARIVVSGPVIIGVVVGAIVVGIL